MKKRIIAFFLVLIFVPLSVANADRIPKDIRIHDYLGAMRVTWVKEWVSLRAEPRKTSERLMQIPLNEIVYNCKYMKDRRFVQCEYQGITGYVLVKYLRKAPEYEPPYSCGMSRIMTREEIIGTGEVVLDWNKDNASVVAAYEMMIEKKKEWEILRIGYFENGEPVWGLEERLRVGYKQKPGKLKVFIGGTPDAPEVMLYDGGYGLSMLDLHSGEEKWNLRIQECYLGDAAVRAIDGNGTCYIAGSEGPDPVAVSQDGEVLWKSAINDPAVYEPYEITVDDQIAVKYRCGSADRYTPILLDLSGQVISSETEKDEMMVTAYEATQTDETGKENEIDIDMQKAEEDNSDQTEKEKMITAYETTQTDELSAENDIEMEVIRFNTENNNWTNRWDGEIDPNA